MFLVGTSSLRQVFITALCHRYKRVCLLSPRVDCKFLGSQKGPSPFLWFPSDMSDRGSLGKMVGKRGTMIPWHGSNNYLHKNTVHLLFSHSMKDYSFVITE